MPFVRIDTVAGHYTAEQRAIIGEVLREAMCGLGVPEDHRFQLFAEHAPRGPALDRGCFGIPRTDGLVAIHITMNAGRSLEQKRGLFAAIANGLHERVDVRREDVFVNLVEVARENWSFGDGEARHAPVG